MPQIYLHGLGQTPSSWEKTLMNLRAVERGVCPDLAALLQGQDASYANLYSALSTIYDSFDEPLDLCGLSLGGILALNYAIDYPEKVHSLVLIAARYKMPKGLLRLQNALFRWMPKSMFERTGFGKAEFLRLCKTMTELDFSSSIHKVICPALVICGEKDSANRSAAGELAGLLGNAELQIIPDCGHEVNVEAPEQLAECLHGFYDRENR